MTAPPLEWKPWPFTQEARDADIAAAVEAMRTECEAIADRNVKIWAAGGNPWMACLAIREQIAALKKSPAEPNSGQESPDRGQESS